VTPARQTAGELDEAALTVAALAASAELGTAAIRARQARFARDIRRASLLGLPDFSLRVALELTGQNVPFTDGWTEGWETNVLVTVAGRVTAWDSLASVWRLGQATAEMKQAEEGEAEIRRGVALRARRMVEGVRVAEAMLKQRAAESELAAERERGARLAYANEMATRGEERGAAMAAIAAELALVEARLQMEYALLELEYTAGRRL
jgi:hypothetical protein